MFESGSEPEVKDDIVFIDFKETPIYWIGMFKKLIQNNSNFTKQAIDFFLKIDDEVEIDDLKEEGNRITYERAFFYISKIDITNPLHIDSLKITMDSKLEKYINSSILFFQEYEEYEKCAHLKKILDRIKLLST